LDCARTARACGPAPDQADSVTLNPGNSRPALGRRTAENRPNLGRSGPAEQKELRMSDLRCLSQSRLSLPQMEGFQSEKPTIERDAPPRCLCVSTYSGNPTAPGVTFFPKPPSQRPSTFPFSRLQRRWDFHPPRWRAGRLRRPCSVPRAWIFATRNPQAHPWTPCCFRHLLVR
jgi:hypothetical protein